MCGTGVESGIEAATHAVRKNYEEIRQ